VVAGGKLQLPQLAPAADLYTGPFFRQCLGYARAVAQDADIRILSPRHGLLKLTDVVAPYDVDPEAGLSAAAVRAQAISDGAFKQGTVVILGGRRFFEVCQEVWDTAEWPLAGAAGLGRMMSRLHQLRVAAIAASTQKGE
jgi:hypothetical protein